MAMLRLAPLSLALLCLNVPLIGCSQQPSPLSQLSTAQATVEQKPSTPVLAEPSTIQQQRSLALPGQKGPTQELLQSGSMRLTTRRTDQLFPDRNRVWKVELHQGERLLASWDAASGIGPRQSADRRWSPGNAAPLPAGRYALGSPQPWGDDLWFDLQAQFQTTRSGLGVHRCYPGTGCICIPSRQDIEALAAWVNQAKIRALTVLN